MRVVATFGDIKNKFMEEEEFEDEIIIEDITSVLNFVGNSFTPTPIKPHSNIEPILYVKYLLFKFIIIDNFNEMIKIKNYFDN